MKQNVTSWTIEINFSELAIGIGGETLYIYTALGESIRHKFPSPLWLLMYMANEFPFPPLPP